MPQRRDKRNGNPARDLLVLYGLDGAAWTPESLSQSRVYLIASYMSFFLLLTAGLGTLQRTRGAARRPAAP